MPKAFRQNPEILAPAHPSVLQLVITLTANIRLIQLRRSLEGKNLGQSLGRLARKTDWLQGRCLKGNVLGALPVAVIRNQLDNRILFTNVALTKLRGTGI